MGSKTTADDGFQTMLFRGVLALILTGGCIDYSVAAQGDASDIDELVVTATRIEKKVTNIPAAIGFVSKEDIQLGRQQLGLDESLAAIPGLFMQNRYNFAQDLRIAIRGFGARSNFGVRGVKILVDGIPESLPDGQGQTDGIDLGAVERIEVLRGPASSLYGNASGGVINITSELGDADAFVEARLSAGAFDFRKFQLKAGGNVGGLSYLVALSELRLDGFRAHSETQNKTLSARFRYALDSNTEFAAVVSATDQPLANDPGGVTLADALANPTQARQRNLDFNAGEALEQQRVGFSFKKTMGERHEFRLRNHYVWRDFANRLPFVDGGAVEFDRMILGGGGSYTYRGEFWGRAYDLVAGVDIDQQDDDRRRRDNNNTTIGPLVLDQNETVKSVGFFVQNELAVSDQLAVTVGVRYDDVRFVATDRFLGDGDDSGSRSLSEASPMIGAVWSLHDATAVYARIATAFETPTTTEFANPSGVGGFNRNIKPQIATNYELGIKGTLAARTRYDIALFTIDVEDELIPFELAAQPGRDFFANAGRSSRHGVEIAVTGEPIQGLRLSLAYTYSDFKFDRFIDDNGNDFSDNSIPGIPDNFLRAEMAYEHDNGVYGAIEFLSTGALFVNNANSASSDSYNVVNVRGGLREFGVGHWSLSPFLGINNLTDEEYAGNVRINAFGGRFFEAAPERHAYAGLVIRWSRR
jgi:iron complex outermembrane receptor protein